MKRLLSCIATIALAGSIRAATFEGKIIRVLDGDTVIIADATNGEHRVRLEGLDASELGAPFSEQSKEALSAMVTNQPVIVKWTRHDRYRRLLGDLYVGPVWINFDMIAQGWAAHAKKYSKDVQLANAEVWARQHQLGIWTNVPPPIELPAVASTNVPLTIFTPAR